MSLEHTRRRRNNLNLIPSDVWNFEQKPIVLPSRFSGLISIRSIQHNILCHYNSAGLLLVCSHSLKKHPENFHDSWNLDTLPFYILLLENHSNKKILKVNEMNEYSQYFVIPNAHDVNINFLGKVSKRWENYNWRLTERFDESPVIIVRGLEVVFRS